MIITEGKEKPKSNWSKNFKSKEKIVITYTHKM